MSFNYFQVESKDLLEIMMASHKPNGCPLKDESLESYKETGLNIYAYNYNYIIYYLV